MINIQLGITRLVKHEGPSQYSLAVDGHLSVYCIPCIYILEITIDDSTALCILPEGNVPTLQPAQRPYITLCIIVIVLMGALLIHPLALVMVGHVNTHDM